MSDVGIEFDASELNALAADLGTLPLRAQLRAQTVVKVSGLRLVAEAKAFAPVDTGFLRSSIGMDVDRDGLGLVAGPTANYGAFVEFGTSRMAPRAYMGPAFDRVVPPFVAALEQLAGDL